jgi:hypothetical protein
MSGRSTVFSRGPGALTLACAALTPVAGAQLRVATWNISNYSGGREADIRTVVYGVFEGRAMAPDVILGQEFISQAAVDTFAYALNTAPGSPGDWAAAPFIDGPDTDSAFFYRVSRVVYLGTTIVGYGSSSTDNQPRNTYRYDARLAGYAALPATSLAMYSVHLKAQGGTNDAGRRLIEAQRIRRNAQGQDATTLGGTPIPGTALPAGWHFLVGGDMNGQAASEPFYVEFTGSQANNAGRFFDPIKSPGTWNNNPAFRILHTQDPAGPGGMDDRHDQILLSVSLIDGSGLDYVGNANIPYSTSTWNDPNHSYRAWGNDGSMCPSASNCGPNLTVVGNTMVGPVIAQSIINACGSSGAGHIPVFLDLRVPARLDAPSVIDVGQVAQGSVAQAVLSVSNAGDVARWSVAGIEPLAYSLSPSAGVSVSTGPFVDAAGGGGNDHILVVDTSTPGPITATVAIYCNSPEEPTRVVAIQGTVVADPPPACTADWNQDGVVTAADVAAFVNEWSAALVNGSMHPDLTGDGLLTSADVATFVNLWFAALTSGC